MNAMWQRSAIIVLIGATSLIGCASSHTEAAPGAGASAKGDDVNWNHVKAVDAAARRAGVDVHWINYPRKTEQ